MTTPEDDATPPPDAELPAYGSVSAEDAAVMAENPASQAARLRAQADALDPPGLPPHLRSGTVTLSVQPPHESFTYGGVTVGTDPTEVPASAVPGLMQSASEAGVTLTEEG
jgi:class 3 adenylate cyclase